METKLTVMFSTITSA